MTKLLTSVAVNPATRTSEAEAEAHAYELADGSYDQRQAEEPAALFVEHTTWQCPTSNALLRRKGTPTRLDRDRRVSAARHSGPSEDGRRHPHGQQLRAPGGAAVAGGTAAQASEQPGAEEPGGPAQFGGCRAYRAGGRGRVRRHLPGP